MNASNLAIVFGPTLMGANTGPNIQDAGWQVRVIDTILQNTYQIFDDDWRVINVNVRAMGAMKIARDMALVIVHYGGTRSDYQFDMVLNFQVF